ncbi:MAG: M1 family aminopeptidase, partial [bacterium]|nr:M1 family aminopeptidase [bacterium]
WWGDMITPSDWRDVWLNEGFATYCEALWEGSATGEQAYHRWMKILNFRPGFQGPVYDPNSLFGLTVYRKGAWVLHMLRRIMGDTNFFATLRDFASSSHAYANATTADFQAICEAHHGESLDSFFQSWVYGTGRPSYDLYWTQEQSGVDYRADITIHQMQREGVFVMPVDLRFTIESADTTVDTTVVVRNARTIDTYVFYLPGRVVDVALDPDNWILNYPDTVQDNMLSAAATPDALNVKVYPNPFNPRTTISFETGVAGPVRVVVYDSRGARIRGLMDSVTPPQFHQISWDGRNDSGQDVASGVYFVRVETRQAVDVRKAILLK